MRLTAPLLLLFFIYAPAAFAQHTVTSKPDHKVAAASAVYKYAEQMPAFPGDLLAFLMKNFKYPELSKDDYADTKVVVQFIVRKDGSLTDAKIVHHAGSLLEQEALRIIRIMPHWIPGKNKGVPVDVEFLLPIVIELDY